MWVLLDLMTRKIKLTCIKSTVYVHYLFETVRIRIQISIKQSDPDPYKIEKQDPDPYRSEKHDPDPDLKGLDPQHCFAALKWILLQKNSVQMYNWTVD